MLVNNSLLTRKQGQLKQVNRKVDAVSQIVNGICEEITEREVGISTVISLTSGLYCTGGGDEPSDPFVLGFISGDYDNACSRLSALFGAYTGNSFENVDIDIGLENDTGLRYDIKADNRIGYFITGADSEYDKVDNVDTFEDAQFISIDAIPIQPTMRAASNNNGTVVSFALEKADGAWKAAQAHPTLIKQAYNGKYYDCFVSRINSANGLTRVDQDVVGWIPELMSAAQLDITYSIHGLNI